MRTRGSMLATGFWLAVTAAAAQTAPAPSPPRLEIVAEVVDAGEVPRGELVRASFSIRNAGGQPLRILGAKPG